MKRLITLCLVMLLFAVSSFGQSSYGFSYSSVTYTEITGGTLLGATDSDDQRFVDPASPLGSTTVLTGPGFPIGFNFTFGGEVFDRLAVNNNGWISLGHSSLTPAVNINSSSSYTPLGSTTSISPDYLVSRIAAVGRDLQAQTGASLRIETIGTTPNQVCVIQWKNYRKYSASGDNFNFQIRLNEGSNEVHIVYGTMTNNATSTTVQVGLRGAPSASATNYHNRTTTTDWSATSKGVAVGDACTLSNSVYPANGAQFEFMPPPPCSVPTSQPTALNLTPTLNSIAGSFTAAPGVDDYLVVRSLNNSLSANPVDGTVYTAGTSLGGGTVDYFGTQTSFTSSNLNHSTPYYYFIFSCNYATCTGGPLYLTTSPLEGNTITLSPGNIYSTASGNWSSTSTWQGGVVPTATDNAIIQDGHTVTVDAATNTCYSLTINSGGTVNVTGTANKLTVNNNLTNNGTLDLYSADGTAYCDLTFAGAYNSTLTGSGTVTDLHTLTVNKGSGTVLLTSPMLEVMPDNLTIKNSASSTATTGSFLQTGTFNGIVKFSGTYTLTNAVFLAAAYSIPSTGGFWLNNPNFTVAGLNGSPTLLGLFRISAGTFNIGTSTGNSMGFSSGSKIYIDGGAVISTGRFGVGSSTNTITYNQSGGDVTVCTVGNTSTTYASFDLGTSATSSFTLSGGTITIQLASTAASGPRDFRGGSTTPIWTNYTGTTLYLGNANSGASKTFFISGSVPPMVITTTSAVHNVSLYAAAYYYGDLLIPVGSTLNLNGYGFWCSGDAENNGTITGTVTGSRFDFAGGLLRAAQTYSGTGAFGTSSAPVLSTGFNNSAGVTLNSQMHSLRANMFLGTLVNSNNLVLGNGTTGEAVVQIGGVSTAVGGAFDTYPTLNLGTGAYTLLYSTESALRTSGYEIPASRTVTNVTINNTNGVTLSGGDLTIGTASAGTLTLTAGILNTGGSTVYLPNTGTSISGGSATSYVNGKLVRTFPASRTATGTYTTATLYPVGNGTAYMPLYIDPTTGAGGTVSVSGQAFLTNSGTMGPGVTSLSQPRWEALITAGSSNFTSSFLRIGEIGIISSNQILQAATAAGEYGAIPSTSTYATGTPPTLTTTGTQIPAASYYGYFAYGDLTACTAPTAQPTNFVTSYMTTTGFVGSFIPANPAASHYLVVRYAAGATPANPVDYTTYAVGSALGTGTVRASSVSTIFTESGLTAGTTYDYYVYSFNNSGCYGPVYYTTGPLFSSVTTCATAVGTPGTPTASIVTNDSFTASWTASSTPDVTYLLDVATNSTFTSFVPGYETLDVGAVLTYDITGLSSNTTYYVRVRAYDAVSGCYSNFSGTLTQLTLCDPVTVLPFTQDFEGTLFPPSCWTRYSGLLADPSVLVPTTSGWTKDDWRNVTSPVDKAARLNVYGSTTKYWLMTPLIDIGTGNYQLDFDLALTDYGNAAQPDQNGTDDKFAVVISTDYGVTWSSANTLRLWDNAGSPYVYNNISYLGEHVIIPLTGYTGVIMIGFYGESTTSNADNDLMINNLVIGPPPECPIPTALSTTQITLTGATLGWTDNEGEYWDVYIDLASNPDPTIGSTPSYNDLTVNQLIWAEGIPSTNYKWFVRRDCGQDNLDVSTWAGPGVFYTGYCIPAPSTGDGQGITNVTFSTVNNTTGAETGWYGNYSAMVGDVQRTATIPVFITYQTGYTYNTKIWIDWNDDLDFDDTGEEVYSGESLADNPTTLEASFVVPVSAPLGNHRMRIGGCDYSIPTPCYTGYYGSFEDYTVNVTPEPACPFPTNLATLDIHSTSADLDWDWQVDSFFDIFYGITGFDPETEGTIVSGIPAPPYTLDELTPDTDYDWYVRTVCGLNNPDVDYYWLAIDNVGTLTTPSGGASEYDEGEDYTWYQYNQAPGDIDWYNIWFYNDPYDETRMKIIRMGFWVQPLAEGTGEVYYVVNWSLPGWTGTGFPTPDDEAFIGRSPVNGPVTVNPVDPLVNPNGQWVELYYIIPDYNPAWVSVDIFGTNIQILPQQIAPPESSPLFGWWTESPGNGGIIVHECVPKPSGHLSEWAGPATFTTLVSCPPPTNLSASNVTDHTADIAWAAGDLETAWEYYYSTGPGAPAGAGIPIEMVSLDLVGLADITTYYFYVRADCGTEFSTWAGPLVFTTLTSCPAPSGLTVDNITPNGADISWIAGGSELNWNVEVGLPGFVPGTGNSVTSALATYLNPWPAEGLESSTAYQAYVQAVCGFDQPKQENFWVSIDQAGQLDPDPLSSGGAPVDDPGEDGVWYLYDQAPGDMDWYNVWFYNDAFDNTRMKIIRMGFWVRPLIDGPAELNYVVNWSLPGWTGPGFPTPNDEAFIGRSPVNGPIMVDPVDPGINPYGQWVELYYVIPDYNPEWVSVDIYGMNIQIERELREPPVESLLHTWWLQNPQRGGILLHECLPKPVGDVSLWTGPVAFNTLCETEILPACESFATSTWPACWSQGYASEITSDRWSVSNTTNAGGTSYEMKASFQYNTGQSWLTSPVFNLPSGGANLMFRQYYNDYGSGLTLGVRYSIDGGQNWQVIYTITSGGGDVGPELLLLPIPASGDVIIQWYLDGNHYQFDYWYIDDVCVFEPCALNVWTGMVNNNWNEPGNWSCGIVPYEDVPVKIPSNPAGGVSPVIGVGINASCFAIELETNASIVIQGTLHVVNP